MPSSPILEAPRGFARRKPLIALLVLALLAAGGWGLWHRSNSAQSASSGPAGGGRGGMGGHGGADRPMPVIFASAEKADVEVFLNGLGTVTATATVTVHPRIDGQLMRLYFREGDTVKAGALLAEIDPRPYQVLLTQAQGQLARDKALLANAHQDLARYKTLVAQDSATRQQLDTQEALVRQYEGTVKADQGSIDSARLQLSYSRVTAPVSGRLGLRQVDVGNVVHGTDTNGLVTITQVQPINVVFTLPEKEIAPVLQQIARGAQLPAYALDRDQKATLASGKLATVDNQIDTTTGTLKMKAEFANADSTLFPNQFVNVRLRTATLKDAIVVPNAAIQRGAIGAFVYVVGEDKKVKVRKVEAGTVEGERTLIARGLAAGERVVIDGTDKLREGAKVAPVSREAAEKAANAPAARHKESGARRREARE
jgi:multidrug efflux system membrane fusion protein